MNKKELVRKAIASVKQEDVNAVMNNNYPPGIYMKEELPQKKIKNAISSFASGCAPEDVAALVEETLFGSGKKGYLFTAEAMYYDKSRLDEKKLPRPLPYDQVVEVELYGSRNTHLFFTLRGGRKVDVYCGIRANFLRLAFRAILRALAAAPEPEPISEPAAVAVEPGSDRDPVSEPEFAADAIRKTVPETDAVSIPTAVAGAEAASVSEPAPAAAEEKDEKYLRAMELFRAERYEEAYPLMKKCHQLEAIVARGWMLENGKGIRKSKKMADSFYMQAAGQGSREGMLGALRTGGVPQEIEQVKERLEFARLLTAEGCQEAETYRKALEEAVTRAEREEKIRAECEQLFRDGMEAYEAKHYTKALSCFKQAAGQGYAEAQFKYGHMYYNGEGIEKNDAEAMNWFLKAARQDHAWAQFFCGLMLTYGKAAPRDRYGEMDWYLKAARQGLPRAQYECGARYYHGQGVNKDLDKAREWFEKAAAQGYENAIDMLQRRFGR